jgi:hypothetical protein
VRHPNHAGESGERVSLAHPGLHLIAEHPPVLAGPPIRLGRRGRRPAKSWHRRFLCKDLAGLGSRRSTTLGKARRSAALVWRLAAARSGSAATTARNHNTPGRRASGRLDLFTISFRKLSCFAAGVKDDLARRPSCAGSQTFGGSPPTSAR